jgi:Bacterial SH3 domain
MIRHAALLAVLPATLLSAGGRAATAYVTDELVLNVFSELNQQGQRLATLHSGAALETLATSGDFTQVRLADGVTGWVKSTYLTLQMPAAVRVKQLEEELDRSRSTTPALAEAAARSEVERLTRELEAKESELAAATAAHAVPAAAEVSAPPGSGRGHGRLAAGAVLGAAGAALGAAGAGFWAGYVTLARRVRRKFGGLRVY